MGLKLSKEDCSKNVDLILYKRMVGSLMLLTTTRPDIMYAVSLISRFMEIPKETHWQEMKIILKYVNETKEYGILYSATDDFRPVGYCYIVICHRPYHCPSCTMEDPFCDL